MYFNSVPYMIFLPLVFLLCCCAGIGKRWLVLLLASVAFYAALKVPYLPVVLCVVVVFTFFAGRRIDDCGDEDKKSAFFWTGVAGNLIVLATLKYLPFVSQYLSADGGFGKHIVSVGVSYFVFQAISYLGDIYLEVDHAERHFGHFALYMSFFPKLLQGPIERSSDFLPQLKNPEPLDYDNIRTGLFQFCIGLLKKIVIADRLALFVDPVYSDVRGHSAAAFVVATVLYAFQLYFDFSGYTDMALGSARLFNLKLTQNFNNPYLATSIADFWRRWHISFSRWILDYIFKPLQMKWRNRRTLGTASALAVTFLASGLWHGATAGFLVWGLLHGIYLAASVYYKPLQKRIHKGLGLEKTLFLKVWQTAVTFSLVCLSWAFFRCNALGDIWHVATHLFPLHLHDLAALDVFVRDDLLIAISFGGALLFLESHVALPEAASWLFRQPSPVRLGVYYVAALTLAVFGLFYGQGFSYTRF